MPLETAGETGLPPPIAATRAWDDASVFRPENLLREARRQRNLPARPVPPLVVLDPDGDLARYVARARGAWLDPSWACYHTRLLAWEAPGGAGRIGVVAHTVGAPFAVLAAEQLFASGCEFVLNLTSAGQLAESGTPPYFVLIDRALRDEGTSYHYLPPADYVEADPALVEALWAPLAAAAGRLLRGGSWTTDAPYRETQAALTENRARGLLLVEMEAAGLYAFARARRRPVLCIAHVTNRMAQDEGDFEKGEAEGAPAALRLIEAAATAWATRPSPRPPARGEIPGTSEAEAPGAIGQR